MMADRIKTNLDEDLNQHVLRVHRETGKPKSEIVNELAREGYEGDGGASFYDTLGQSLFVVGPIVALLSQGAAGIGLMLLGLGLMVYGSMRQYLSGGHRPLAALKLTLGV